MNTHDLLEEHLFLLKELDKRYVVVDEASSYDEDAEYPTAYDTWFKSGLLLSVRWAGDICWFVYDGTEDPPELLESASADREERLFRYSGLGWRDRFHNDIVEALDAIRERAIARQKAEAERQREAEKNLNPYHEDP